jgi:SAM-dependent methyltransferase
MTETVRCDLCGATVAQFILTTPRLDGPLVRCVGCDLHFVVKSVVTISAPLGEATSTATAEPASTATVEMKRLATRARELNLVEPQVEQSETPWRVVAAEERLRDLRRFITSGRLLEIGCSTGEFLGAAHQLSFTVKGIEADLHTSAAARARGLDCLTGSLLEAQLPPASQEAIALYHVIEHLPSPQAIVRECERLLTPGGWLVLEAPNLQNLWYRCLGTRWRQFIPDHLYFFTPATLRSLCERHGLRVVECRSVGKAMSLRLFISRVSRYSPRLARVLNVFSQRLHLDDVTVRLKLGDVMRLYAQKP